MNLDNISLIKDSANLNKSIWTDSEASLFFNSTTDACCAIKIIEKNLFIVFKYTDTKTDWKYNFKFYPKKIKIETNSCFKPIRIHRGHFIQYKSLIFDIKPFIHDLMNSNELNNIIFSGFSLGGSLCQIAAWDFISKGPVSGLNQNLLKPHYLTDIHCYSFGSSNPGNSTFSKEFNKIPYSYNFVYNKDPIPVLPPRLFGYSRTKNPIWIIPKKDSFEFLLQYRSFSQNFKIIFNTLLCTPNWTDHNISKIQVALDNTF